MSVDVKRTSQLARTATTVRLRSIMEEAQRLEIATRIRELREKSPYSQQGMADKLDLTLRAYQKMEQVGTTRWERCEELAEIHGVTPEWIWSGEDKLPTPDVGSALNGSATRIEAKLDELLGRFDLLEARLVAAGIAQRSAEDDRPAGSVHDEATGR